MSLSNYVVQQLTGERGDEFAEGFLKADLLGGAVDQLFSARLHAELTLEDVANRLGIPQKVILHWEADRDGHISLRNYTKFALACGMVPRLVLVPFAQAKAEKIAELQKEGARQHQAPSPRTNSGGEA